MRFHRFGHVAFNDTARKRVAFLRKQKAEREALPLFAAQIAEEQISVDQEMAERDICWERSFADRRQRHADDWRKGRARMRQYPEHIRSALMNYWNRRCPLPADPAYFLTMMHMWDTGRLTPESHRFLPE